MYLVLSAFTSSPISLVADTKDSACTVHNIQTLLTLRTLSILKTVNNVHIVYTVCFAHTLIILLIVYTA